VFAGHHTGTAELDFVRWRARLVWGIVEVPKSETQVSADLRDEADTMETVKTIARGRPGRSSYLW
jgi:hypothetical protein